MTYYHLTIETSTKTFIQHPSIYVRGAAAAKSAALAEATRLRALGHQFVLIIRRDKRGTSKVLVAGCAT